MTNAEQILSMLDSELSASVELTLYGRAALQLGFSDAPDEYALSRDVDAVFWIGQAEKLNETTNFWEAIDKTNDNLADQELYISHFFTEDQVVLRPPWRNNRIRLPGDWSHLILYRLANMDLLLSKLMRDDPIDQADARFIVTSTGIQRDDIVAAIQSARIPESAEIVEQFQQASARLLAALH